MSNNKLNLIVLVAPSFPSLPPSLLNTRTTDIRRSQQSRARNNKQRCKTTLLQIVFVVWYCTICRRSSFPSLLLPLQSSFFLLKYPFNQIPCAPATTSMAPNPAKFSHLILAAVDSLVACILISLLRM